MRLTNMFGLKVEKAGASFIGARVKGATITRVKGATIKSVSVTDLLAYWRSGHGANNA